MRPVEGLNTHVHNHSIWHRAVQLMNIKHTISHRGLKLEFPIKGIYTVLTRALNNNDGANHASWHPRYESWAVLTTPKGSYNKYLSYWNTFFNSYSLLYLLSFTCQCQNILPTLPHFCTIKSVTTSPSTLIPLPLISSAPASSWGTQISKVGPTSRVGGLTFSAF